MVLRMRGRGRPASQALQPAEHGNENHRLSTSCMWRSMVICSLRVYPTSWQEGFGPLDVIQKCSAVLKATTASRETRSGSFSRSSPSSTPALP